MSELIDNTNRRRDLLKHLILQLHNGEAPEAVKKQLVRLLGEVPYDDVVAAEQELIAEGLPTEEVLKLCDIHSDVLKGQIDRSDAAEVPPGHPVHTFQQENRALEGELALLDKLCESIAEATSADEVPALMLQVQVRINALADVEKHYQRKENLLFPFLEKHGITGPPTVMWGKHDETRALLKTAIEAIRQTADINADEAKVVVETIVRPAASSIAEMVFKEEEILLPMSMDTLTESEWGQVQAQSLSIGYCLFDPSDEWRPRTEVSSTTAEATPTSTDPDDRIQLPSGSLNPAELHAILSNIPFDLTFVDNDDTVRYFTQGRERIFQRNRAILGRKVQMCHPPKSVHMVEKIIDDFKSGAQDRAAFWITLGERFVHIEYFALRDNSGAYLGTLEVSQDLTEKRALSGEQRLLNYGSPGQ
ncbi:MAG: DUF438 domain-containing protein [candidate division Zixibacteria bacterium]|nr:DUF438 domain-containing protein [candidate division Zixibacteria bacterium]MDH3935779.1 DUF438 domain-containing protein [candidate division Zixibacteria bacterium]MDH4035768.1 DUF438 domain-containing protein [candidate division Zixibacteria bacterium]